MVINFDAKQTIVGRRFETLYSLHLLLAVLVAGRCLNAETRWHEQYIKAIDSKTMVDRLEVTKRGKVKGVFKCCIAGDELEENEKNICCAPKGHQLLSRILRNRRKNRQR